MKIKIALENSITNRIYFGTLGDNLDELKKYRIKSGAQIYLNQQRVDLS
jgi:hypothetical protein